MSKICQVTFNETAEQKAKLEEIIATYKDIQGSKLRCYTDICPKKSRKG